MPITKSRQIAKLFKPNGIIKESLYDSDAIVTSAQLGVTADVGTATYSSADTLPASADNGDQALVTSTNRLYIYSNGGWYNIALINSTPYWSTEASSSYNLNTDGTSTTITILAVDSEGINVVYTATTDSDFDNIATITKDSDNGRTFTITPTDSENGTAISGTGTITFRASDGINLVSTLSTFSLTFITIVANSAETTILLKADTAETDNQADASTNNHTITENGDVTSTAFSPYHPGGYSTYFDGTNDHLTVTDNISLNVGTGDFTVEAWFYLTADDGSYNICSQYASGNTGGMWLGRYSNVFVFRRGGIADVITASSLPSVGEWHHVAVSRASGSTKMFIDGTQTGSTISSDTNNYGVTAPFYIGSDNALPSNGVMHGYIRDFRLVKGTGVYASNFTPPTERLTAIANTSLLACHAPYIADGSTNGNTITVIGNPVTKIFGPYDYSPYTKADHNGSLYCDGTSDGIEIASAAATQFGTGEWTIEGWFYPYNQAATQVLLYGYENAYSSTPGTYELYIGTSGAQTTPQINGNNGSWATSATSIASTETFQYETWNHIVWSRSGNNLRIFVNGKSGANHAISASQTYDMKRSESQFFDKDGASGFRGYVSDLRVVKGTAVYTADFTPPTAPLTAITNTQLLTCKNNNFFWDASGVSKRFNLIGTPTASNTQRKFTTSSSLYCGTHAGALSVPSGDYNFDPQSDFTVEAWFYWELASAPYQYMNKTIIAFSTSWDGDAWSPLRVNNDYPAKIGFTGSAGGAYSAQLVDHSTWYHIAFVRNGNTIKMYLDGIERLTNTNYSGLSNFGTQHPMNIGSYNPGVGAYTDSWHGYIQDLKISQYAKYTSNFTPPTEELEG